MITTRRNGALPYQTILSMVRSGIIAGAQESSVKPSSLDLTLSDEIYEVEGSLLPKRNETVRQMLGLVRKKKHDIKKPLLRDKMYIIRLNESMKLPKSVYAFCNPKSSSGRIDVHVRLLADYMSRYDAIYPAGWAGELWVSVIPRLFPVRLYEGVSLNQLRFYNGDTRFSELELEIAMQEYKLFWRQKEGTAYKYEDFYVRENDGSVIMTLDLSGDCIGYEGIVTDEVLDLKEIGTVPAKKFFKKIRPQGKYLKLKKGSFYILSTHESLRIPPFLASEMVPMDDRAGEFRSHYAGFFDPGWGWGEKGEGKGRPITLEVRPFEDIIVRQGQPIGKVRFERLIEEPEYVYDAISSNYTKQSGPKLAKHFRN